MMVMRMHKIIETYIKLTAANQQSDQPAASQQQASKQPAAI